MLTKIFLLLTLGLLCVAPPSTPAEEPGTGRPTPLVLLHEARVLLPTRIFQPPDFAPERAYPLIVGFHGYGATAEGFGQIGQALAEMGFLVALPESGYPLLVDCDLRFQWFPATEGGEADQRVAQLLFSEQVPDLLADLKARYAIDRAYTLGFSEGAVAAMGAAIDSPEDFAGSIHFGLPLFSEDWLPERELLAGKNLRLLFLHGEDDERVPSSISQMAHSFFREAGYDATLRVFAGGHSVPRSQLQVVAGWIRQ